MTVPARVNRDCHACLLHVHPDEHPFGRSRLVTLTCVGLFVGSGDGHNCPILLAVPYRGPGGLVPPQAPRAPRNGPGLPTSRVSSLADNSIVAPVGTHRVAACHPRSLCGARVARLSEAETETEQAMLGLIRRTPFSPIESAAASDPVLGVKRGPRGEREDLGWVRSHPEGAVDHAGCVRRSPQLRPRARSRKADSRPRPCGKAGRSYRDDTVL